LTDNGPYQKNWQKNSGKNSFGFYLSLQRLPAALIKKEQRHEYFNHLIKIQSEGQFDGFIGFICDAVEEGFRPYWAVLGIDPQDIAAGTENHKQ